MMPGLLRVFRQPTRALALAIIVCALIARILVPQGWMPVATSSGWRITPCSGTGPMTMAGMGAGMKAMHHGAGDPAHDGADHVCGFASLTLALDEPPPLALDLPGRIAPSWSRWVGGIVSVGHGLAAPPPPSTGPPLA